MRTSPLVLALLGLTALGSMTTQANSQFFEEDYSTSEFDENDIQELLKISLPPNPFKKEKPDRNQQKLVGEMARVMLEAGKLNRGLIKNFTSIYKHHKKDKNDIVGVIQNLGAESRGRLTTINSAQRNFNNGDLDPKPLVELVFQNMKGELDTSSTDIGNLLKNKYFEKMTEVKAKVKQMEHQIPGFERQIKGFQNDAHKAEKDIQNIISHIDHVDSGNVVTHCKGSEKIKCKESVEQYYQKTNKNLDHSIESMNTAVSKFTSSNNQAEQLQKKIEHFPAQKRSAAEYTKTMNPITNYQQLVQECLTNARQPSHQRPASNKTYQTIKQQANNQAHGSVSGWRNSTKQVLAQAAKENDCAEKEVDNFVNHLGGRPTKPLPRGCH